MGCAAVTVLRGYATEPRKQDGQWRWLYAVAGPSRARRPEVVGGVVGGGGCRSDGAGGGGRRSSGAPRCSRPWQCIGCDGEAGEVLMGYGGLRAPQLWRVGVGIRGERVENRMVVGKIGRLPVIHCG